jgi:putative PIN family toxin of toxin-antitoxin system
MTSRKLRIILDTNILVSFLITKEYDKLDSKIFAGKILLLFSDKLIDEFISVVQRPKFKNLFSPDNIEVLVNFFLDNGLLIDVESHVDLCRDQKDNFLLNLAIDGKADYLITGDKDLLVLSSIGGARIITMPEFLILID